MDPVETKGSREGDVEILYESKNLHKGVMRVLYGSHKGYRASRNRFTVVRRLGYVNLLTPWEFRKQCRYPAPGSSGTVEGR